jgi:hypothetical protein
LAAWSLSKINEITSKPNRNSKDGKKATNDDIEALETAFGNLDAKLN